MCPRASAPCTGVRPPSARASMSAPAETSALTTSVWPLQAAMCRGVKFPLAFVSVLAPPLSNSATISNLLSSVAMYKGVTPRSVVASMYAPESSSNVTNSDLLPHFTAQCKGTQPPKLGALMSSPIRLNSLRTLLVVAVRQKSWLYRELCHLAPKRLKKLATVSLWMLVHGHQPLRGTTRRLSGRWPGCTPGCRCSWRTASRGVPCATTRPWGASPSRTGPCRAPDARRTAASCRSRAAQRPR